MAWLECVDVEKSPCIVLEEKQGAKYMFGFPFVLKSIYVHCTCAEHFWKEK